MQKLYCYVDESGQDPKSEFFVVVAIVNAEDQSHLRKQLEDIEDIAQTHKLKWHKTSHDRKMRYLSLVLERKIAAGKVYAAHYKKPIPYFFPMIEVLGKAIREVAQGRYLARIYIDGIDKQKSQALTNALRASCLKIKMRKLWSGEPKKKSICIFLQHKIPVETRILCISWLFFLSEDQSLPYGRPSPRIYYQYNKPKDLVKPR